MANTKVWVNILDILWPVGSLYCCVDGAESSPAVTLGGTWTMLEGGQFTVGATTYVYYKRVA